MRNTRDLAIFSGMPLSSAVLVPGLTPPSAGASEVRLTPGQIKERLRTFLEAVAARGAYVYYGTLAEGFPVGETQGAKPGAILYPGLSKIVASTLEQFNRDDAAAGRPFVTSVVLASRTMLPRRDYFKALAAARGIEIEGEEQMKAAHSRELEAARKHWKVTLRNRPEN